jgi:hypothetical protein
MEFTTQLELQSQTTRLVEDGLTNRLYRHERGCHPPWRAFPDNFIDKPNRAPPSPDYNSEDSQSELLPLHSPLLGESLLVSFPLLINMLKFSR